MQVDLGCTGTKGGPVTNEHAQVLDFDDAPIVGLYAAGNTMAAPPAWRYGGAGGTIGPALVWGHRAALHAVSSRSGEHAVTRVERRTVIVDGT